jgi:hypothetical protein
MGRRRRVKFKIPTFCPRRRPNDDRAARRQRFSAPAEPVRVTNSGDEPDARRPHPGTCPAKERSLKMPTKAEAFPSAFYSAADIKEPILLTIDHVRVERLGEGRDAKDKYVAFFTEPNSKGLVISPTKWDAIALIARNDDSDTWPGVQIVLYVEKVLFNGKLVDGIKIRAPRGRAPAPKPEPHRPPPRVAAAETAATFAEELNDEVPF